MYKLSSTPVPDEYQSFMNQKVLLGKKIVSIRRYENERRMGSWDRGLKWSQISYGFLVWRPSGKKFPVQYSPDHGHTWYGSFQEMKKQRKGKVKLSSSAIREPAFESIQVINRQYLGPNYRWYP